MEIQGKIKLLKSNQVDSSGIAVAPLASELEFGQIAVNYSALNPSLFFKDANGKVVKIVTEEVIADTLADILGGSAADLSTLKELLDAFASSDIATTQASILNRLGSVESNKVDKVAGKGLSTNDYTTTEKNKLAGIGSGANVTSVAGKTGVVTLVKGDVGLSNVLNKEQLGKDETALKAKNLEHFTLSGLVGKTVREVRNLISNTITTQGTKGFFVIRVTDVIKDLVANWDTPEHILISGSAAGDINVNSVFSNYAFITITTYEHKFLYTVTYANGSFGAMCRVMYRDDKAVNTTLFDGLPLSDFAMTGTNKAYDSTKMPDGVHGGKLYNAPNFPHSYYSFLSFGYGNFKTILNGYNNDLRFKAGNEEGTGDWRTLYHNGNTNHTSANWTCNTLYTNSISRNAAVEGADTEWLYIRGNNVNNAVNKKGGGVAIYGGRGSGTATGGDIQFLGSAAGVTGNTLNGTILNMVIKGDGSVGMGVSEPTARLDVNGNINSRNVVISAYGADKGFRIGREDGPHFKIQTIDTKTVFTHKEDDVDNANGHGFFDFFVDSPISPASAPKPRFMLRDRTSEFIRVMDNKCVGIYNSNPTERLDVNGNGKFSGNCYVGGNGLFSGNVTAKGDVVAYSAANNVRIEPTAGGASNLFDLGDVELPTTLTNNFVLAYDATKKKWTAKESVGTGGAKVDYDRLTNLPTTFTPKPHNHEDATYVSDVRLKQNINPLDNALNTVLALDAKSFGWTTEAKERYNMKDEVSYGYIAQDVEKIIPDIVKELETGDGYIGVEYIKVIPFITEAIKQLHFNTIESNLNLKKELNKMNKVYSSLFNDYKQLKAELAALKAR